MVDKPQAAARAGTVDGVKHDQPNLLSAQDLTRQPAGRQENLPAASRTPAEERRNPFAGTAQSALPPNAGADARTGAPQGLRTAPAAVSKHPAERTPPDLSQELRVRQGTVVSIPPMVNRAPHEISAKSVEMPIPTPGSAITGGVIPNNYVYRDSRRLSGPQSQRLQWRQQNSWVDDRRGISVFFGLPLDGAYPYADYDPILYGTPSVNALVDDRDWLTQYPPLDDPDRLSLYPLLDDPDRVAPYPPFNDPDRRAMLMPPAEYYVDPLDRRVPPFADNGLALSLELGLDFGLRLLGGNRRSYYDDYDYSSYGYGLDDDYRYGYNSSPYGYSYGPQIFFDANRGNRFRSYAPNQQLYSTNPLISVPSETVAPVYTPNAGDMSSHLHIRRDATTSDTASVLRPGSTVAPGVAVESIGHSALSHGNTLQPQTSATAPVDNTRGTYGAIVPPKPAAQLLSPSAGEIAVTQPNQRYGRPMSADELRAQQRAREDARAREAAEWQRLHAQQAGRTPGIAPATPRIPRGQIMPGQQQHVDDRAVPKAAPPAARVIAPPAATVARPNAPARVDVQASPTVKTQGQRVAPQPVAPPAKNNGHPH